MKSFISLLVLFGCCMSLHSQQAFGPYPPLPNGKNISYVLNWDCGIQGYCEFFDSFSAGAATCAKSQFDLCADNVLPEAIARRLKKLQQAERAVLTGSIERVTIVSQKASTNRVEFRCELDRGKSVKITWSDSSGKDKKDFDLVSDWKTAEVVSNSGRKSQYRSLAEALRESKGISSGLTMYFNDLLIADPAVTFEKAEFVAEKSEIVLSRNKSKTTYLLKDDESVMVEEKAVQEISSPSGAQFIVDLTISAKLFIKIAE